MSFTLANQISASALTAQRLRMDVISENIANATTTRTDTGGPYKRKVVMFEERSSGKPFTDYLTASFGMPATVGYGVKVSAVVEDQADGPKTYEPTHPDADEEGYVSMPNVNVVEEMVNMISASRSYEANLTAMNTTKAMIARVLESGKS